MLHRRLHYVDWLRALIVYGIAFYHVSLAFAATSWLVSNREHSLALTVFAGFTFTWGLSAMFLISGVSTWFSLRNETAGQYVRARILRLGVPLVALSVLLTPFQRYVTSSNPPPPVSRLGSFYAAFFHSIRLDQFLSWVNLYALHLWFLAYLLAISLIALPVLLWMRSPRSHRAVQALLDVSHRRGGMVLLALPLCVFNVLWRQKLSQYQDLSDFLVYFTIFLLGALVISDPGFEAATRKNIVVVFPVAVASAVTLGLMVQLKLPYAPGGSQPWTALFNVVWGVNTWCWILTLLYVGIRWLDRPNRAVGYASESILPFYVLHHPIALLVCSVVVAWDASLWLKVPVAVVAVYAITLTTYELGVRHLPPLRFAFGLHARRRALQ